jgi:hypothetical protein
MMHATRGICLLCFELMPFADIDQIPPVHLGVTVARSMECLWSPLVAAASVQLAPTAQ